MSTLNLTRWGGLAVFLGSTLWAMQKIGWQLFIGNQEPLSYPQPAATILWIMGLMAAQLILLGLPALYAHQARQAGSLGAIAFVVVFIGMALVAGNAYFGVFIQASLFDLIILAEEAGVNVQEPVAAGIGFMTTLLLYTLGWLLFGLSSLRARVLPRWAAVVVLVGLVSGFLFLATSFVLLAFPVTEIGIAWLGYALWRKRGDVLAQVKPVTVS
jgi:hypothetical protein